MDKLLRCHFCGGEAEYYGDCDMAQIRCSICGATTSGWWDEPEEAVEDWNRRVQPQPAEARPLTLDELKERDGKPVYIVELCDAAYNRWEILDRDNPVDLDMQDVNLEGGDCYQTYKLGKTWLAYDHEPGSIKPEPLGCSWCNGDWVDNFTVIDDDFGQPLTYRHVKYCPMCGKKLEPKQGEGK